MFGSFFRIAAQSHGRRRVLRLAIWLHLSLYAVVPLSLWGSAPGPNVVIRNLGMTLLLGGIIEGALLIGWRLTQLPRSQSLEFLLVSPMQPTKVFYAEVLVGITRVAWVTLSGLPILLLLSLNRHLSGMDVLVLLIMPWTWGVFTGVGLTMWAYEPIAVRRWLERLIFLAIMTYLVLGVLAAERLPYWLTLLPEDIGAFLMNLFRGLHFNNPFSVMEFWCIGSQKQTWPRMVRLELFALVAVLFMTVRAASRLKGHFQDRHYRQKEDKRTGYRETIGDRPLSWWSVKRVMEYAGCVNLYLAGGFSLLYAMYLVAGESWPSWLGRGAFQVVEIGLGGVAGMSTGLVVLAAVPAAFQYGLWDSSVQDRCKRLELILMTELDAYDFLLAAWAAAWRRGRGYAFTALILWLAGWWSGQLHAMQIGLAFFNAAGMLLVYFALGYWSFMSGVVGTGLGSFLTLGLPLAVAVFHFMEQPWLVMCLPPGGVFAALRYPFSPVQPVASFGLWLLGIALLRYSIRTGERQLRRWFDLNLGRKAAE